MSDEAKTVEIIEPVKTEKVLPTRNELKEQGWSAEEMNIAEKHKMVREEKGPENNGTEPTKAEELNEVKPEVKEVKEEKKPEVRGVPNYELSPEQEAKFFEIFPKGTPQNGQYLRLKTERRNRQAVEARNRELEAEIEALRKAKPHVQVDENGQEIDPEDVPMTAKMWKEMQRKEAEERAEQERVHNERAMRISDAIQDQEDFAKSFHPDYDETMKLAKDLIANFDKLGLEKWKQDKVRKLYEELRKAAENADQLDIDGYTTALIGYEIGTFHPNYKPTAVNGHSSESNVDSTTKANGSLTPETMKRIEANTQRRASSASIPGGGGKRSVSPSEVTITEFNRFDAKQRLAFREKHPEEYARIMRG